MSWLFHSPEQPHYGRPRSEANLDAENPGNLFGSKSENESFISSPIFQRGSPKKEGNETIKAKSKEIEDISEEKSRKNTEELNDTGSRISAISIGGSIKGKNRQLLKLKTEQFESPEKNLHVNTPHYSSNMSRKSGRPLFKSFHFETKKEENESDSFSETSEEITDESEPILQAKCENESDKPLINIEVSSWVSGGGLRLPQDLRSTIENQRKVSLLDSNAFQTDPNESEVHLVTQFPSIGSKNYEQSLKMSEEFDHPLSLKTQEEKNGLKTPFGSFWSNGTGLLNKFLDLDNEKSSVIPAIPEKSIMILKTEQKSTETKVEEPMNFAEKFKKLESKLVFPPKKEKKEDISDDSSLNVITETPIKKFTNGLERLTTKAWLVDKRAGGSSLFFCSFGGGNIKEVFLEMDQRFLIVYSNMKMTQTLRCIDFESGISLMIHMAETDSISIRSQQKIANSSPKKLSSQQSSQKPQNLEIELKFPSDEIANFWYQKLEELSQIKKPKKKPCPRGNSLFKAIKISLVALQQRAQTGDILLFKTKQIQAKLQRIVTKSRYGSPITSKSERL